MPPLKVIVLAAGVGSRLHSPVPKPLIDVGGQPLLGYVLDALEGLPTAVVVNPHATGALIAAYAERRGAATFVQHEPLGTGHAVLAAAPFMDDPEALYMVVCADTPLITAQTLTPLLQAAENFQTHPAWKGAFLCFQAPSEDHGFGVVHLDEDGHITGIAEARDRANTEAAALCNSGIVIIKGAHLLEHLQALTPNNAQGEYYLTDLPKVVAQQGGFMTTARAASTEDVLGVNTSTELAQVMAILQDRWRYEALAQGAHLLAPSTVFLSHDTQLSPGCRIEPHVVFGPGVVVDSHATLRAFSHIEGAHIHAHAVVGPYARIRPGTVIESHAKVGNFVEIKKSHLHAGAKVSHLSYIGDSVVGAEANVGAGTITCNYDGVAKHRTTIGSGAFIGSNTALVAPVSIGDKAVVGAGSVITKDVPPGALAVARGRQIVKDNYRSSTPMPEES